MYRCIANLEIDLEGLSEFYSDVSEYETLNMYQIISAWLQDDLDGPNPEKRCSVYQNMLQIGCLCYQGTLPIVTYLIWEIANLVIILKVLIIYMRDFYKPWRIIRRLNLSMSHYLRLYNRDATVYRYYANMQQKYRLFIIYETVVT